MIAVVDYGVGNLFSLRSSLEYLGQTVRVTGDPAVLAQADRLILPGVGAFGDAARQLRDSGLGEAVCREADRGKPLLGICLGMQLLFQGSLEFGVHRGLGLLPGWVRPIAESISPGHKVPHIGWNALHFLRRVPLFRNTQEGDCVYFVHSFHAASVPDALAVTDYGGVLTAAAGRDNILGCQFHPEKSGRVGLGILQAFCE